MWFRQKFYTKNILAYRTWTQVLCLAKSKQCKQFNKFNFFFFFYIFSTCYVQLLYFFRILPKMTHLWLSYGPSFLMGNLRICDEQFYGTTMSCGCSESISLHSQRFVSNWCFSAKLMIFWHVTCYNLFKNVSFIKKNLLGASIEPVLHKNINFAAHFDV